MLINRDDLFRRYDQHLSAFFAEQGIPEDFFYQMKSPGQEPTPILNTNHARFYATWLAHHGYISEDEEDWLDADIRRAAEGDQSQARR